MNLNTWQEAINMGFTECGTLVTGMSFMGPLKIIVAYKR